jgi:DNA-binding PadR family transcriptional regulator
LYDNYFCDMLAHMTLSERSPSLSRMVILWLLSEGPLHGYRIKRILEDEGLGFWFPIDYASIYTVLRTLAKGGLIKAAAVEREGQRPERTRFRITREGRRHLAELLEQAWREPRGLADPLQLALAARSELTEDSIQSLLMERVASLQTRLESLERMARSAPAVEMVDRQMALTQAELGWARTQVRSDRNDHRPTT